MKVKICLIIILIAAIFLVELKEVKAQSSSTVNATVKVSICGNGVVEGGEDCEGANLNNKTCTSLGYSSGPLTCDISCSYDTSICLSPTTSNSQPSANFTTLPTPVQQLRTPTPIPPLPVTIIQQIGLPFDLVDIDPNGDGRIKKDELYNSIKLWVFEWKRFLSLLEVRGGKIQGLDQKKKCDINNDQYCDLTDLSIVLYHVEE